MTTPSARSTREARAPRERLLKSARFEIIPTPGAAGLTRCLTPGTTVHVMCPPLAGRQSGSVNLKDHLQGADSSVGVAIEVAALGHRAIPHLSAKTVRSRQHLRELLTRMNDAGIQAGFFPGGDGAEPAGPYSSAVELLRDLGDMDHGLSAIGVGAYPEGHREIPEDVLLEALISKQSVATFMVSEICFEPDQTLSWLKALRESGVRLPLHVGAPGAVGMRKLMEQLKHWGVGSAVRFLRKQHGMMGAIVRRKFSPSEIVEGIAPSFGNDQLGIAGLQLYTLNDVAATEAWRRKALAAI